MPREAVRRKRTCGQFIQRRLRVSDVPSFDELVLAGREDHGEVPSKGSDSAACDVSGMPFEHDLREGVANVVDASDLSYAGRDILVGQVLETSDTQL